MCPIVLAGVAYDLNSAVLLNLERANANVVGRYGVLQHDQAQFIQSRKLPQRLLGSFDLDSSVVVLGLGSVELVLVDWTLRDGGDEDDFCGRDVVLLVEDGVLAGEQQPGGDQPARGVLVNPGSSIGAGPGGFEHSHGGVVLAAEKLGHEV